MEIIPLLIGIVFYFIPSIIAKRKNMSNRVSIYFINLFLGWSLIGWFAALFLAVRKDHQGQVLGRK
ncbi:superinfection immunity protein [Bacillus infantis]|uniref:Superinfection immunity protein n=1 Tax=Bacillus infantis TaxID=324767 RepID=A0A5D4R7Y8_9BACI|nr:superinfection immunity protein [Bacillus infantis]TYS45702.1 superinfection immunity protein [Bacillus infantis]